jgi:hypothetical protein
LLDVGLDSSSSSSSSIRMRHCCERVLRICNPK